MGKHRKYRPVETIPGNYLKDCMCGCGIKIWNWDKFHDIRNYVKGHAQKLYPHYKGNRSPGWTGGRYISAYGYVMVFRPDHRSSWKSGYIPEHRLVYEEYHKCCLMDYTVIHHINRIRSDNRPENLEAMKSSQHMSLHRSLPIQ